MGTLKRLLLVVSAAIILLILLYLAGRSVASLRQGYSWSEMDWEQKGSPRSSD